jgi:hypothetical protein
MFSILIISHSLFSLFIFFSSKLQKRKIFLFCFCFLLVCNCEGVGAAEPTGEWNQPREEKKSQV